MKRYERDYFERWYRGRHWTAADRAHLRRKVALAVATTEFHLGRPLRSVLDVGCGEGAWQPLLKALRPRASYLGLEPSAYAVQRFGHSRNIRPARFADLVHLRFDAPFDLVVCADVMHYLPLRDLRAGLPGLAELCGGVAYLETYCRGDAIEGDREGFQQRPASTYRRLFAEAGLAALGSHCWLSPALAPNATALEHL